MFSTSVFVLGGCNNLRDLGVHNFHVIRKPNLIIVLLFIQNISKFLTSLPPSITFFKKSSIMHKEKPKKFKMFQMSVYIR